MATNLTHSTRTKTLLGAGIGLVLLTGLGWASPPSSNRPSPDQLPGQDAPARITIPAPGEPGEPLVVSGQVFQPDGRTLAPGVVVYVYHTDAKGLYNPQRGAPPRLRGWMKTDAQGRYEYRTIRPAPYPGREIPAHVHTQLWGGGWPAQWNEDLLFADDPFLKEAERRRSASLGTFAFVCAPHREASVLRCAHNLRLKPQGDTFEENIRHGFVKPAAALPKAPGL
jgi:protocatechuate 3,4-dioxygenase beta subunit